MLKASALSNTHRVLMISSRSDIGGGPKHVYDLAIGLGNHDLYFALPVDGEYYLKFIALFGSDRVFAIPRQKFSLVSFFQLLRYIKTNRIQVVHSHGKGAGLYSRALRLFSSLCVIHTLHGYHDERYTYILRIIYNLWERVAILLTDKVICVSKSERALFAKKTGAEPSHLVTVPNGTPTVSNSPPSVYKNKVVTVARFDHAKNLTEFLMIARELKKSSFHLFGDGEDRARLETYIANHSITNVTLHGFSSDVITDIADADVYLSTSLREGMPISVLEAMSLGIPVVATDVVGNRDAVSIGLTGYLYELGNLEACIDCIERAKFLSRSKIREFHSKNFSSEQMVANTLKVYEAVLAKREAQ